MQNVPQLNYTTLVFFVSRLRPSCAGVRRQVRARVRVHGRARWEGYFTGHLLC